MVTVTLYNPAAAFVTLLIDGFCNVEEKPFGPDQTKVPVPLALKLSREPVQSGPLLFAVITGGAFTCRLVLADAWHPDALVASTVYVPAFAWLTLLITGFCWMELKPLGPDQIKLVPPAALSVTDAPSHTGPLLAATTTGAASNDTLTVAVELHPPALVTVTE